MSRAKDRPIAGLSFFIGAKYYLRPAFNQYTRCLVAQQCAGHLNESNHPGFGRWPAKHGYTIDQIVELIYNPKPEHWPDYTQMAAMPQVPHADAVKIATWINSLGSSATVDKP